MNADISTSTFVHNAMTTDRITLEITLDMLSLQITAHCSTDHAIRTSHREIAPHCSEIGLGRIGEHGIATNIARIQARYVQRLQAASNIRQVGYPVHIGQFHITMNILQE